MEHALEIACEALYQIAADKGDGMVLASRALNRISDAAGPGADPEMVWRICPYVRDLKDCERCPPTEEFNGDQCTRGCYAMAEEAVNIVQTGNPWRKTPGQMAETP